MASVTATHDLGEFVVPSDMSSMAEPLRQSIRRHPDRIALVTTDQSLTYRELGVRVDVLAHALHERGIDVGDRVAILLPNGIEIVETYFAIQELGAIAVPLNFRSVPEEIQSFCHHARVRALVLGPGSAARVRLASPGLPEGMRTWTVGAHVDGFDECPTESTEPIADPLRVGSPDAVSRIQFTGGSTGRPKAVVRTHRADLIEIEGTYRSNGLASDPSKTVLIQCPLDHHGGHDWLCMALAVGSTVIIEAGFDPGRILADIEEHRVSYMIMLPPTTYARLLDDPRVGGADLSSVRVVQSSAGGMTREIASSILRHFPSADICFGWGQTESGLGSSLMMTRDMLATDDPRLSSVGTPMPFIEMTIVDRDGREVPDGVAGECLVRSSAMMAGYDGQPELTRAAFTDDGWLHTGDVMVRDPQGCFHLRSRLKEMIKSGGENVFVGEVESVIREHPAVRDCIVFGVPDAAFGEAVACAVELVPGATLTLAQLQEFCVRSIASFKKPRHLSILDSLDRDFSGKVNRERIIERCGGREDVPANFIGDETAELLTQVSWDPEIWRLTLPLEDTVERTSSCYFIRGDSHGDLLVDVGGDSDLTERALTAALDRLGVEEAGLDVFITHEHCDHWGMLARMGRWVRRIFASPACIELMDPAASFRLAQELRRRMHAEGFSQAEDADLFTIVGQSSAPATSRLSLRGVNDGDVIEVGGRRLSVWLTHGHSAGQACLFHEPSRTLLCGDEVLALTTPPLLHDGTGEDRLGGYLALLDTLDERRVARILPGHGPTIDDVPERVATLRARHLHRLDEVCGLVADGHRTAREIAPSIAWHTCVQWHDLSPALRWLTVSETLVYLDHAVTCGLLTRRIGRNGGFLYELPTTSTQGE